MGLSLVGNTVIIVFFSFLTAEGDRLTVGLHGTIPKFQAEAARQAGMVPLIGSFHTTKHERCGYQCTSEQFENIRVGWISNCSKLMLLSS